jgi:hypothetical protein
MATSSQTQTEQFMAALSAAEHVTAATPVDPSRIVLAAHSDWGFIPGTFVNRIGVQLHFGRVDEVQQFAEALHVDVAEREHPGEKTYTFADGVVGDVPFRAWALSDAKSSAVAA